MESKLEILTWDRDRLALTGRLEHSRDLFDAIRARCEVAIEYWQGWSFTFSFPAKHRRDVVRTLENWE